MSMLQNEISPLIKEKIISSEEVQDLLDDNSSLIVEIVNLQESLKQGKGVGSEEILAQITNKKLKLNKNLTILARWADASSDVIPVIAPNELHHSLTPPPHPLLAAIESHESNVNESMHATGLSQLEGIQRGSLQREVEKQDTINKINEQQDRNPPIDAAYAISSNNTASEQLAEENQKQEIQQNVSQIDNRDIRPQTSTHDEAISMETVAPLNDKDNDISSKNFS